MLNFQSLFFDNPVCILLPSLLGDGQRKQIKKPPLSISLLKRAIITGGIAGAAIIIGVAVAITYGLEQTSSDTMPFLEKEVIRDWEGEEMWVHLLLSGSEEYVVYNEISKVVANLAVADFNAYQNERQAAWGIKLLVNEFDDDPKDALEEIYADGVRLLEESDDPARYPYQTFLLGPTTSSAIEQLLDYEANDVLIISHGSTAPSLAIPDNIFRLTPDDTKQARATAKAMSDAGIDVVVPIYRDDVWGNELRDEISSAFAVYGGVADVGIVYTPDETSFVDQVLMISEKVGAYIDQGYSTENVAVLVLSFGEGVTILNHAASYEDLASVTWFGSDSTAQSILVTSDPTALEFAEKVGLISPLFLVAPNERTERIDKTVVQETGSLPSNNMYALYDAVWIHGLTINEGKTLEIKALLDILPRVAEEYDGVIGSTTLNAAGDLASADYELFWIQDGVWKIYGIYTAFDDKITLTP